MVLLILSGARTMRAEAWNSSNSPRALGTFEYRVFALPLQGIALRTPWPGDNWTTARDSINYRWDGNAPSPAEKVEQAFALPGFASAITYGVGIYAHGRPKCALSSECTLLGDGSACVFPRAASGPKPGRCIPAVWGIDSGWAAAAISEPPFVVPTVKSGVTFEPGDVEAIASLVYGAGLPIRMLGARCNKATPLQGTDGRLRDQECRDLNPGSLHVVLGNSLGLSSTSLVEDRMTASEVSNRPLRAYRVTNSSSGRLKEVSRLEAGTLLGTGAPPSTVLPTTTFARDEERRGSRSSPSASDILVSLRGDADADLYVRRNASPSVQDYDCRPYSATSNEDCMVRLQAGETVHWMVRGYAETSTVSLTLATGSPSTPYPFNAAAAVLFHVELEIDYVTTALPGTASRMVDVSAHTQTDRYAYVLEVDHNGRVVGGEWVGPSRVSHPDFVWWPTGAPTGTTAGGLTYTLIRSLLDGAKGP
jgi:hypothetical protein